VQREQRSKNGISSSTTHGCNESKIVEDWSVEYLKGQSDKSERQAHCGTGQSCAHVIGVLLKFWQAKKVS